jgi:TonB family protein
MMFIAFLAAAVATVPQATAIDPGSWFSTGDYPAEALSKGTQGDTTFEADIDAQGKPTACRITHSSGSAILDQTTCDIVLKRGRFKPAMSHHKPVAGRHSQKVSWKLPAGSGTGYAATILDFTKDPQHPTCSIVGSAAAAGLSCELALRQLAPKGTEQKLSKLVALVSITSGDEQPYRGEASWGRREAFVAIDFYPPKEGSKAECAVVANEGPAPESNPCAAYAQITYSEADKRTIKKAHIEQSLFVVEERSPSQGKCKQGESKAEVRSCV